MESLIASTAHGALLAEKVPFSKDQVVLIRFLLAFLISYRNLSTLDQLQLPIRPQPQPKPAGISLRLKPSFEKCADTIEPVSETLRMFMWKDEYPDFTVLCENRRYLVHKHVLETASPYFERMFRFNGAETNKNEVELQDTDAFLMEHILDFIYAKKYTLPGGTTIPTTGWCNHISAALRHGPPNGPQIFKRKCICSGKILCSSHLLSHICIYAIADYFDMPDLKEYARQGTKDVLHVYWDDEELDLVSALEEAFTSTPDKDRGIKDVVVNILKDHPGLWVDEGDVNDWLQDNPAVFKKIDR